MKISSTSHIKKFAKRHHLTVMLGETDHEAVDRTSVWRQRGVRDLVAARGIIDNLDVTVVQRRLPSRNAQSQVITICTIWFQRGLESNNQLLLLNRSLPTDIQMNVKHLRHSWRHEHVEDSILLYPSAMAGLVTKMTNQLSKLDFTLELSPRCITAVTYPALKTDESLEKLFRNLGKLQLT